MEKSNGVVSRDAVRAVSEDSGDRHFLAVADGAGYFRWTTQRGQIRKIRTKNRVLGVSPRSRFIFFERGLHVRPIRTTDAGPWQTGEKPSGRR